MQFPIHTVPFARVLLVTSAQSPGLLDITLTLHL